MSPGPGVHQARAVEPHGQRAVALRGGAGAPERAGGVEPMRRVACSTTQRPEGRADVNRPAGRPPPPRAAIVHRPTRSDPVAARALGSGVMPSIAGFWAVIPAGGAGTRLWPLSRADSPKFLHDLTGSGRSLLQATVERLTPLVEARMVVVTGAAHRAAVGAQLPGLDPANIVAEPLPRDSMAAIGLAAALIERRDPDAVIGSFAADHLIGDPAGFAACVERAVAAARDGWLVTIGIEPTHAATASVTSSSATRCPGTTGCGWRAFVEKP